MGLRSIATVGLRLLRGSFDAFPADARSEPGVTVMAAPSAQDVAIGLPLMVSVITILVTILIHALALLGIFHFVRRQHLLRRTGVRFWRDLAIVSGATMLAGVAHLVGSDSSGRWCSFFAGSSADSRAAFYHSAMNYTTLGYGDVIM